MVVRPAEEGPLGVFSLAATTALFIGHGYRCLGSGFGDNDKLVEADALVSQRFLRYVAGRALLLAQRGLPCLVDRTPTNGRRARLITGASSSRGYSCLEACGHRVTGAIAGQACVAWIPVLEPVSKNRATSLCRKLLIPREL